MEMIVSESEQNKEIPKLNYTISNYIPENVFIVTIFKNFKDL